MKGRHLRYLESRRSIPLATAFSYTRFSYQDSRYRRRQSQPAPSASVSSRSRTQAAAGARSCAFFYLAVGGFVVACPHSLRGFARGHLLPGEARRVFFPAFFPRDLSAHRRARPSRAGAGPLSASAWAAASPMRAAKSYRAIAAVGRFDSGPDRQLRY